MHDPKFDGSGMSCRGVVFLSHLVCLSSRAILNSVAKFFGALVEPSESVELSVLGDGLNVVEASEGIADGINGNLSHQKCRVEDIRMLTNRSDRAELHGVFSCGKARLPTLLPVFIIFEALNFFLFLIGLIVVLIGGRIGASSRRGGHLSTDGNDAER